MDEPLQPTIDECEGVQEEVEAESEERYGDLEIVEQSALDDFNSILKRAQQLAAETERMMPQKRPRKYDSKSKRTLKHREQRREDLAKQGYLSVFKFMAHVEEKTKKKAWMEQLVEMAAEGEQASEESALEEMDTEDLVSECVSQVHQRRKPSTYRN